jgi:spore coat protein H
VEIEISQDEWDALHEDPNAGVAATARIHLNGNALGPATLEIHGGFAKQLEKKSYRVRLPQEIPLDLFGGGPVDTQRFVLSAQWIDPTFSRNKLTHDLMRELGGLAPRVSYARVCFNGAYHGLYTVIERIDEEWLDSVDLDNDAVLYKASNHNANWKNKADPMSGFELAEGEPTNIGGLGELLAACSTAPATFPDFEQDVSPLLNLKDFMTWQLVHVFADDRDTFTKNYYLYDDFDEPFGDPKGQMRIVAWDSDATFGINWDGAIVDPTNDAWHGTDGFSPRLFSIPEYRSAYLSQFERALARELSEGSILSRLEALREELKGPAQEDFARWKRSVDFDEAWEHLEDSVATRVRLMQRRVRELRAQ